MGFYDPAGKWHPDSDHGDRVAAGDRVHYLNGGSDEPSTAETIARNADAARYTGRGN